MSLSKVLEVALGELGNTEDPPGSNMQKYGAAYGVNGVQWCVELLWWIFREAGESKAFFNGGKTASCTSLMKLYQAEGLWFTDGNYQRGDIPIMTFAKNREVQHCGLIIGKAENGGWITVEGNTSPGMEGSQSNGGCVAKKIRFNSNILGVCRPQYKPEEEPMKDDITGHWAEKEIKRCMKRGIIKGYPDGSFAPDKPITRAEAAVMMDRLVQLFIGNDDGK